MDDKEWMDSIVEIKELIKEKLEEEKYPPNIKLKLINLANELVYIIDEVEEINEYVVKD